MFSSKIAIFKDMPAKGHKCPKRVLYKKLNSIATYFNDFSSIALLSKTAQDPKPGSILSITHQVYPAFQNLIDLAFLWFSVYTRQTAWFTSKGNSAHIPAVSLLHS